MDAHTTEHPKTGSAVADQIAARKRAFLAAYAKTANIKAACRAAKVGRTSYYAWTEHDEAFALAAKQAREEAADLLELHAIKWATVGIPTVKEIYERNEVRDAEGTVTGWALTLVKRETSKEVSPTLLIFLLKGAKPEKFRERFDVNHSGSVVKAIDREAWEAL